MKENYDVKSVAIEINGRLSVLEIKVMKDTMKLKSGKVVQAICFIKANGDLGAIQFWTPAHIDDSVAEAEEQTLLKEQARKVFAS